jgi:integrase
MAKVSFTARRVEDFKCPPGKAQAFLWDANSPGLGLRVTPGGKPAYVFQGVFQGGDIRITIGSPQAWKIPEAQAKAREFQRQIDQGQDPRDIKRDRLAANAAEKAAKRAKTTTVQEAWDAYLKDRRAVWGERHYQDHIAKAKAGGVESARGTRGRLVTIPGPLHPLMAMPLGELTAERVQQWAADEAKTRPTAARLAWRLLRAFLSWCAEQNEYRTLLEDGNPAKTRKAREALGRAQVKRDSLQREQLAGWFAAVRQMNSPVASAYLQTLLLTGARPSEVLGLTWDDIGFQWRTIAIRDKVEGERIIPLTPYVRHVLAGLPRKNDWVFASERLENAAITLPNHQHGRACKVAGIDELTLHGLRRSFGTLAEWVEVPAGISAQLMGHKPSATAEKHYRQRPLDLLRVWATKIEAWMLEQAGVEFNGNDESAGKLRAVA